MKLAKCHSFSARDSHFFANPVVNIWNSFPDYVVSAPSVASFKHRIYAYIFVFEN